MPSRFPLHEKAVSLAHADIGVAEDPPHSNSGRKGQRSWEIVVMQGRTWLKGTNWPWCVAAVIDWLLEAGFKLPWLGAGAYAFGDWARKVGWAVPLGGAIPGDPIIFAIGSGHCAMLAEPWRPGQQVHTIDGNSSDQVKENWRSPALVYQAIHIPEQPAVLPKAKPPVFEVVGSETGHKIIYVSGARAIGRNLAKILGRHPHGVIIREKKAA